MTSLVYHGLLLAAFLLVLPTSDAWGEKKEEWQNCDVFVAPSDTGWGVFAARDFDAGDVIEVVSGLLPTSENALEVRTSVLDDYVNPYIRNYSEDEEDMGTMQAVLFGSGASMYNHHREPNVALQQFSIEPFPAALGFIALSNISAGDQLYVSYGEEDGGADWFKSRGIEYDMNREKMQIHPLDLDSFRERYCSKIKAGIGRDTWNKQIVPTWSDHFSPTMDPQRLAPFEVGMGDARAKTKIRKGDRIEISVGLVVSQRRVMKGSALRALLFSWEDLKEEHRRVLRSLRRSRALAVTFYKHSRAEDGQEFSSRSDIFESFEDLGILPTGNLALVRRGGAGSKSNCELRIGEKMASKYSGIKLELVATKNIKKGQVLVLDLPVSASNSELKLLQQELKQTAQPYYVGIFKDIEKDEL